jgi:dipeptidyl aminopeptidase/acylaminoacyl peptidase
MVEPMIPRRKLFGNPTYVDPAISPDGKWLSWIAPVDGVLNIWVAPVDDLKAAEPLTRTKGMPIGWHMWSEDGAYILFSNDENGDENNHIFVVDSKTKELRDMTPITGVAAYVVGTSRFKPREIVIGLNNRDERWHDTYKLNLDTGERELIYENKDSFELVMTDAQLVPRLANSTIADGSLVYWRLDQGAPVELMRISHEDSMLTRPITFSPDGTKLLMCTSLGRNTSALVERDWQSGAERMIASHSKFDIDYFWLHPKTAEPQLVGVNGRGGEWIYSSDDIQTDWSRIQKELQGFETQIVSSSLDNSHWILRAHKPQQGDTYFHMDRTNSDMRKLFSARPELKQYKLAPMQVIEAKSRDGLDLYSFLTLPAEEKGNRPEKPLPLVLFVHGGPWTQDYYGYDKYHQWLANRGYAVLSVNYRASTGYGKAFLAAGDKEHAGKMHNDLIDMVDWAIKEGIADPEKVAITGASYGGYASFVGATFTPDIFCCSVPVVGITNLENSLESMPPYWAGFTEFMYRSYGDPRTEAGKKLLAERSPIHKVDNITNRC